MATRERWITGAVERGVPLEQATAVVDYICETDGGVFAWIPPIPKREWKQGRNAKIFALWLDGVPVSRLAERFNLTTQHIGRILRLFASMN